MQADLDEALRYLGVRSDPDGRVRAQLADLAGRFSSQFEPRHIWRAFPVHHGDEGLRLGQIALPGRTAAKMLADCKQCAVLVCTLGASFDALVRRMQARDMVQAVMLDALGSALVEAACDEAEREIAAYFPEHYPTDRFSPGYGDLPLALQPQLLEAAEARRIGVSLTPSLLMTPQKSVSALIGLADVPQVARIRGCAFCAMQHTCNLRKAGTTCDV